MPISARRTLRHRRSRWALGSTHSRAGLDGVGEERVHTGIKLPVGRDERPVRPCTGARPADFWRHNYGTLVLQ